MFTVEKLKDFCVSLLESGSRARERERERERTKKKKKKKKKGPAGLQYNTDR